MPPFVRLYLVKIKNRAKKIIFLFFYLKFKQLAGVYENYENVKKRILKTYFGRAKVGTFVCHSANLKSLKYGNFQLKVIDLLLADKNSNWSDL